jgi:hypothetical protein
MTLFGRQEGKELKRGNHKSRKHPSTAKENETCLCCSVLSCHAPSEKCEGCLFDSYLVLPLIDGCGAFRRELGRGQEFDALLCQYGLYCFRTIKKHSQFHPNSVIMSLPKCKPSPSPPPFDVPFKHPRSSIPEFHSPDLPSLFISSTNKQDLASNPVL